MYRRLIYLIIISLLILSNTGRADLAISNGTFDGGVAGNTDVVDWYDLNNPTDGGSADWWATASTCLTSVNPFPDGACMLGDSWPAIGLVDDRYIYQAIGTKASCRNYSVSIDFAQPTDGSVNRSPSIKVEIYQGSFSGAADDVDIAEQGLTLIDSVSSDTFPDMAIHNFTSPLDLSSANTKDMLWIRISNLPGQGSDAGSWVVVDNIQITSEQAPCGKAFDPIPADNSIDILRDILLSWTSGEFANTHNFFFGTNSNDVNNATIENPLSAIFVEGLALDANSFNPGRLEFDTTYYWRVDEVNIPSKPGLYKGDLWQFTIEPEALKLPKENIIKVTAISSLEGDDPNNTVNEAGLGLDPNFPDQHSAVTGSWLSSGEDVNNAWIQYDFDKVYKIHEMLVWNYNHNLLKSAGFNKVLIEYSEDGNTWTKLTDVNEFNKATGRADYEYNTAVTFDAIAKSVRITALSNWGLDNFGLSEVRFTYIPVWAREPKPTSGTSNIPVGELNLGWRAGRDADQHYLYIATDMNSVVENVVTPVILDGTSYSLNLDLAKTYYWKVNEVNMAEAYTTWDGNLWSFSTVQSIVVEDFEVGYDDTDANAVWNTWLDGYGNESVNGALMGYEFPGPYLSTTNYNGGHSAPIRYNNTTAGYSEVKAQVLDLPIGTVDWTIGSPRTLTIWFRGDRNNVVGNDELYCIIDGKRVVYEGGFNSLADKPQWMKFDINLSTLGVNLSDVDDIAIGIKKIGATGGSGVLLIDYICLSGLEPFVGVPPMYIEAEAANTIVAPTEKQSVIADASGGQYISTPTGTANSTNAPPANGAGIATYKLSLTAGQYIIWGRYSTGQDSGSGANAFWVRFNGAASNRTLEANNWARWSGLTQTATWRWDDIHASTGLVTWTIPADGTYNLEITYRYSQTKLDALMIVKTGN
ncbi:MAG: discoidin domain-containing protein [Sedimentisphaerales bacterium]|nr:discoidin domain-containing protein [Sedimentisphaerales bacterium]